MQWLGGGLDPYNQYPTVPPDNWPDPGNGVPPNQPPPEPPPDPNTPPDNWGEIPPSPAPETSPTPPPEPGSEVSPPVPPMPPPAMPSSFTMPMAPSPIMSSPNTPFGVGMSIPTSRGFGPGSPFAGGEVDPRKKRLEDLFKQLAMGMGQPPPPQSPLV
jgi:hypothetical protein